MRPEKKAPAAMSAAPLINMAAYKFASLSGLKELRARLVSKCRAWGLKGTILLSTEGINVFVAGDSPGIEKLLAELRSIPGLGDLSPKYSENAYQPFNRMLVRIKREIIAFGKEAIQPASYTSRKIQARDLKQWLDEGRPVTLLDTRNDYEVKLGTFKGAVIPGIDRFRDFPEAVRRLPEEMKEQPVVMFCTGGIRCEKAGPFMENEGFKNILQLDGGILKYFEECGGAHYDGECFVFDQRVGVDPALRETESAMCFSCQAPLTEEEQAHPHFDPPHSCPHCFKTSESLLAETLESRHEKIRRAATPLPGSVPYDNRRPLIVPQKFDGAKLIDFLSGILGHVPSEEWQGECEAGRIVDGDGESVSSDFRVRTGERIYRVQPGITEPDVNTAIEIVHEDDAIVVLNKPAPLPMHPGGRFNRNTLEYFLDAAYEPHHPRPAHRLDANTTGLVVCSRTRRYAGRLQPQFSAGTVEKIYLVRVSGNPTWDSLVCDAPISAEPGELGTRTIDPACGLPARTEFRVLSRTASERTTLLEARPLTGRTNQIRVHLWNIGLPVAGDPAYLPNRKLGATLTLPVDAPPLCLHAWQISFDHPKSGQRVRFSARAPDWVGPFPIAENPSVGGGA